MEKKVFRSRISVLMMVFILLCILPGLVAIIRSGHLFTPAFYCIAGVIVFCVLLVSGFRYVITDNHLQISIWGTCKTNIPISQILSVKRSYNPLSSPAGSLKRLSVHCSQTYKWTFVLISPVREQEFLDALKKINPNIYIRVSNRKGWWRIWDWDI
jgi:hypothetical protein